MSRVNVLLTVDTEVWPFVRGWPVNPLSGNHRNLADEVSVYLDGRTNSGEVGIGYQIKTLNEFGLCATFFIEPFFADVAGAPVLERAVQQVLCGGQEVGLHVHTEWFGEIKAPNLPSSYKQFIRDFSDAEQVAIVSNGLMRLKDAGAENVQSFRAGSYGANRATLKALLKNGIRIDTSYNPCYAASFPELDKEVPFLTPFKTDGILEIPIPFIEDMPNHRRHVQLNALSFGELRHALLWAWRHTWPTFVIVWHSAEFARKVPNSFGTPSPERILLRRFRRLCEFLAQNSDKFHVMTCSQFDPSDSELSSMASQEPIRSPIHLTGIRYLEQALGRVI